MITCVIKKKSQELAKKFLDTCVIICFCYLQNKCCDIIVTNNIIKNCICLYKSSERGNKSNLDRYCCLFCNINMMTFVCWI